MTRLLGVPVRNFGILICGCSWHMSENASLLNEIKKNKYGSVTFGDNKVGKIIGIGRVG